MHTNIFNIKIHQDLAVAFLKKLETVLPRGPVTPLLGIYKDKSVIRKIRAPLSSQQHYAQQTSHGDNPSVHWQDEGIEQDVVHIHRNHCLITVNGLFNSRKLHTMLCRATQDGWVTAEFWQNVIHWKRGWHTTPHLPPVYSPWEPHEAHKKANRHDTARWDPPGRKRPMCYWGRAGDDSSAVRRKQCYLPQHERNERIILSEATQREASITRFHLYVKSKIEHKWPYLWNKQNHIQNRLAVTGGRGGWIGSLGLAETSFIYLMQKHGPKT